MRIHLMLGALLVACSLVSAAAPPRRVYCLTWGTTTDASTEGLALTAQLDRQLRDELQRRGALVLDHDEARGAILLRPRLDVSARGLELNLVGMRGADRQLLGSVSMKASGSSRKAQVKAIVKRACLEADRFK